MSKTIYLVEDLEFKKNFEGLSLYKVGYTNRNLFSRIIGLQNWTNLKVLYSTTDEETSEDGLRERAKFYVSGFKCFYGWNCLDTVTRLLNPNISEYLENKYIPEKGTEFKKFGGGLTEYFIGRDWEYTNYSFRVGIERYLKSEKGIEENQKILERVLLIQENKQKKNKSYE